MNIISDTDENSSISLNFDRNEKGGYYIKMKDTLIVDNDILTILL